MKLLRLPTGPFFLSSQGRYLPSLTDLVIAYAAFQQRVEIQEQLFALRLRQKCFVALAERAPAGLVQTPVARRASLKILPGGSVGDGFHIQPDSPSAPPLSRPGPTTAGDETVKNKMSSRRTASVFDSPNPYPKGRW